jgi:four helix bundle protein
MEAFEQLEVWKRSCRLCAELYRALANCREYGFRDQITRAALSIPSNIAEGYERNSKREFVRFLNIAKGSCGELRTQLYIGVEIGLLRREAGMGYVAEVLEISKMLQGLVKRMTRDATPE